MEELLKETGDKQLLRLVRLYAMFPVKILARYIAMQLHRTKHRKVVQLLQQQVRQAAKYYPERKFSGKEEKVSGAEKTGAGLCKRMGRKRIPGGYLPGRTVYGIERFC